MARWDDLPSELINYILRWRYDLMLYREELLRRLREARRELAALRIQAYMRNVRWYGIQHI